VSVCVRFRCVCKVQRFGCVVYVTLTVNIVCRSAHPLPIPSGIIWSLPVSGLLKVFELLNNPVLNKSKT
jgi:hypothetical protein